MAEIYISKISKLLLKKYNTEFDEKNENIKNIENNCEKRDIKKIMKSYLTDLNKLNNIELQTLTKVNVNDTHLKPIKCNYNKNIKKIQNFNFIQDVELVKKIIKYRKYEIIKEVTLIKWYFSVYVNIITKIISMQYKKHNKVNYNEIENSLDSKIYEDTLKKLFEYKETLENILTQICLENKNNLLKNTLCKYNFLETNIIKITGYIN
jgi:hypothetical protein|uniref:Uncharacterized protein n=1 Tax=viral metagenome TaxID=1070528 RepID=A0A6C0CJ38_9ZZZZ